ncbi:hypothetical protein [Legionella gresilensis]|uniref:hypothetical protein n=1 Tax=Legionella gresilensis TaxID=91823 RepID=UPI0010416648|nr:hypothetical protein [Legionella gresilensis]
MPKFEVAANNRHGNFSLTFPAREVQKADNNSNQGIKFYGQSLSELQMFRRYGNLPDNNILSNKLINILGKNLLRLAKQRSERVERVNQLLEKQKTKGHSRISEWQREIEFYSELESRSNAFTISLLDTLSSLEATRFESNDKLRIGKVDDKLKGEIGKLYDERIQFINGEITKLKNLRYIQPNNQIKIDRLQRLVDQINKNKEALLKELGKSDKRLQSLYRNIMDDFAHEQRALSVYQHTADRALDYANQSLTEAYQDASYAMEAHVFSPVRPTDEQLWQNLGDDKTIILDSRNFPHMKKEDALLSAALINYRKDTAPKKPNPIDVTTDNVKAIKEESKKVKKSQKSQESEQKNAKEKRKGNIPAMENVQTVAEIINLQNSLDTQLAEDAEPCSGPTKLHNPGAVKFYHSSDLFSAIGLACVDFGKYFEHQMGAKHPAMTGAFFVAASATFGAAGVGAAGGHFMLTGLHYITKALTINGKLGVSPEKLESIIQAISAEWLKLTHTEGLIETIIMDGFGLPKINYIVFDTIINGFEHKDTLYQLAQNLAQQDLEYYTAGEQAGKIIIQTAQVAVLFAIAIALGVGTYKLAHLVGHGLGTEIAKDSASALEKIINVPTEVFTNLFLHQSVVNEVLAIASAMLTIKTAGLFLGKGVLLLNHLKNDPLVKVTPEETQAYELMIFLKELYETNYEEYKNKKSGINIQSLLFYQYHMESLIAKSDAVAQFFGDDFLQDMGIQKSAMPLLTKVGSKLKAFFVDGAWDKVIKPLAILIAPVLILPLFLLIFSENFRKLWINTFINFCLGTMKIANMAFSAIKTISIATYGTIQRLAMVVPDGLFNLVALANYGFQKGRAATSNPVAGVVLGLLLGAGTLVGGAMIKTLLAIAALTIKILSLVGKVVKGVATVGAVLLSPAVGIVGTLGALPYVGIKKLMGHDISLADTLKNVWTKGVLGFIKGPSEIANRISNKITEPLLNKITSVSRAIDQETRSVKGAPTIYQAKDKVTIGIGTFFDRGKEIVGNIFYQVKNQIMRRPEQFQQRFNKVDVEGAFVFGGSPDVLREKLQNPAQSGKKENLDSPVKGYQASGTSIFTSISPSKPERSDNTDSFSQAVQ